MTLTQKEKADRYDALQAAIKHTLKNYNDRAKRSKEKADEGNGVIHSLHLGYYEAYREIVSDLKRWV